MTKKIPAPPPGAGAAGRRLWRSILAAYTLTEVEEVLLRQAVAAADHVAELDAVLTAEGLVAARDGVVRMHPALAEVRQQRLVLARLLSALRLPVEDSPSARSQRRGIRGVYSTGVVS